jgi:glycosyltransferase involved in cell wall biosynthesis
LHWYGILSVTAATLGIVVPVYNVEHYLAGCLESIRCQQFKSFEAILVNDGSTDRSGEIADEFAKRDCRFRVVHTANGGLGRARNTGSALSEAPFICFVDSDDLVTPEGFRLLVSALQRTGSDFATGKVKRYEGGIEKRSSLHKDLFDQPYSAVEINQTVDTCLTLQLGIRYFAVIFMTA